MSTADRIIKAFKKFDVNYVEHPGMRARVRPGTFTPKGSIVHHTAGHNDLMVIVNGRPDLLGPLSNFYVPQSGKLVFVSAGRCNHAGQISKVAWENVLAGRGPKGDAGALGYPDDGPVANGLMFGFECENHGTGKDPWEPAQVQTILLANAALCDEFGYGAPSVIGHREATKRKIDPKGLSMTDVRAGIQANLDRVRAAA